MGQGGPGAREAHRPGGPIGQGAHRPGGRTYNVIHTYSCTLNTSWCIGQCPLLGALPKREKNVQNWSWSQPLFWLEPEVTFSLAVAADFGSDFSL